MRRSRHPCALSSAFCALRGNFHELHRLIAKRDRCIIEFAVRWCKVDPLRSTRNRTAIRRFGFAEEEAI